MTQEFLYKSQPYKLNMEAKILATSIDTPFMTASRQLKWKTAKTVGLGFNQAIMGLLDNTHATLVVYIESFNKTYFARPDKIKQFMKNNQTSYKIRDTVLTILPIEIFTHKMEHAE